MNKYFHLYQHFLIVCSILDFDELIQVEVLASLQQPKKISIQGNDGKVYAMLCKPKDDLRKDNRLMEVNGIINKCLMKDADARWRQLHIRTYVRLKQNLSIRYSLVRSVNFNIQWRHLCQSFYLPKIHSIINQMVSWVVEIVIWHAWCIAGVYYKGVENLAREFFNFYGCFFIYGPRRRVRRWRGRGGEVSWPTRDIFIFTYDTISQWLKILCAIKQKTPGTLSI